MVIERFVKRVEKVFSVSIPRSISLADLLEIEDAVGILFHIDASEWNSVEIARMERSLNEILARN